MVIIIIIKGVISIATIIIINLSINLSIGNSIISISTTVSSMSS